MRTEYRKTPIGYEREGSLSMSWLRRTASCIWSTAAAALTIWSATSLPCILLNQRLTRRFCPAVYSKLYGQSPSNVTLELLYNYNGAFSWRWLIKSLLACIAGHIYITHHVCFCFYRRSCFWNRGWCQWWCSSLFLFINHPIPGLSSLSTWHWAFSTSMTALSSDVSPNVLNTWQINMIEFF